MSETSRRNFIAVAGAGAAAAGTVALSAGSADAASGRLRGGEAQESVVAFVEDHHGDTLHLMVGDREVVVRDRDLVSRILRAAGGN